MLHSGESNKTLLPDTLICKIPPASLFQREGYPSLAKRAREIFRCLCYFNVESLDIASRIYLSKRNKK